jgi:hypothetical protein
MNKHFIKVITLISSESFKWIIPKYQCVFSIFIQLIFQACQHKRRIHLGDCAFNWIMVFSIKTVRGTALLHHMCLKFSSCQKYNFFQIKRIISSQKNILVHREAIISLARMWNETNDRTNKEQTHCHTGGMCLRARADAFLPLRQNCTYQQNVTYCVNSYKCGM